MLVVAWGPHVWCGRTGPPRASCGCRRWTWAKQSCGWAPRRNSQSDWRCELVRRPPTADAACIGRHDGCPPPKGPKTGSRTTGAAESHMPSLHEYNSSPPLSHFLFLTTPRYGSQICKPLGFFPYSLLQLHYTFHYGTSHGPCFATRERPRGCSPVGIEPSWEEWRTNHHHQAPTNIFKIIEK